MARSGPITLSLPAFGGVVKQLIVANIVVYLGLALLAWVAPGIAALLSTHLSLVPVLAVRHFEIWQIVTYAFLHGGLLHIFFNMLTLWFIGGFLEDALGSRWLAEIYFVSVVGAALTTIAISYAGFFHLTPYVSTIGASGGIFGLLVAFGMLFGDQIIRVYFVFPIKAKYLVAIYILIAIASLLRAPDGIAYLAHLGGAFFGFLYVKFAPRRGFGFITAERLYGIRNDYYRWKRRQAAKKFEVYMRKQDPEASRKLRFDADGRYIDPDKDRNPKDKRWMN
jgi:membrane associated rhomboid family serine protease